MGIHGFLTPSTASCTRRGGARAVNANGRGTCVVMGDCVVNHVPSVAPHPEAGAVERKRLGQKAEAVGCERSGWGPVLQGRKHSVHCTNGFAELASWLVGRPGFSATKHHHHHQQLFTCAGYRSAFKLPPAQRHPSRLTTSPPPRSARRAGNRLLPP